MITEVVGKAAERRVRVRIEGSAGRDNGSDGDEMCVDVKARAKMHDQRQ